MFGSRLFSQTRKCLGRRTRTSDIGRIKFDRSVTPLDAQRSLENASAGHLGLECFEIEVVDLVLGVDRLLVGFRVLLLRELANLLQYLAFVVVGLLHQRFGFLAGLQQQPLHFIQLSMLTRLEIVGVAWWGFHADCRSVRYALHGYAAFALCLPHHALYLFEVGVTNLSNLLAISHLKRLFLVVEDFFVSESLPAKYQILHFVPFLVGGNITKLTLFTIDAKGDVAGNFVVEICSTFHLDLFPQYFTLR